MKARKRGRTLYRYVDWNTCYDALNMPEYLGRTLYRYVDWNTYCITEKRNSGSRTLYRYVDWNFSGIIYRIIRSSRTLYRYVDWNTDVDTIKIQGLVVPYIGTWIETDKTGIKHKKPFRRTLYRYVDWNRIVCKCNKKRCGRTLYRYVDWNYCGRRRWSWKMVVPYIGTWIETWDG